MRYYYSNSAAWLGYADRNAAIRRQLLLLLTLLLPLAALAQGPDYAWATHVVTPLRANDQCAVLDMAVDQAGNSYVIGSFLNSARFGSTTHTASDTDVFVAKVDSRGNAVWVVKGQGLNMDFGNAITVDTSGNVYVAGAFTSPTFSLGSVTLANSTPPGPTPPAEIFVAKLDPNGNCLWAAKAGGTGADFARGVAVDAGGNVYVTGEFGSAATFGGTVLPYVFPGRMYPNSSDVFVAKLNARGQWRWAVRAEAGGGSTGNLLALDGAGHVVVGGYAAAGTTRLGSLPLSGAGAFVAQLDTAGRWQWASHMPGFLGDHSNGSSNNADLAVDRAGNTWIASGFSGTIQLGSATLTSTGSASAYVARLTPTGAVRWAAQISSPVFVSSQALAVDEQGNCLVTGRFTNATRFGPLTVSNALGYGIYAALLDRNGSWRWVAPPLAGANSARAALLAPASGGANSAALALGPGHTVHISGNAYDPALNFGNGIQLPGQPQFSHGAFLARTQPYASLVVAGDSLLCNGGQVVLTTTTTGRVTGYRWNTGATTASITVDQPGLYSVQVTFDGGYTLTETHRVRTIAPVVQISAPGPNLCVGDSRTLTATAPGAQSLLWSTGATTPAITIAQPGTYRVTARYGSGCAATAQVTVQANTLQINGRLQLCPGQSTTLTTTTGGAAVTSYQWSTGATTPMLLVAQAGRYTVTVRFADGCQLSATHSVGPPVARVATVSGDSLLCPGATLSLTALNPDAQSYQWSTGATTPTITVGQPGLYSVLLTYPGGCTSRDSLRVLAAPLAPAFTLGADTTLCLEQPLLLRAPALSLPGGVAYRWSDGSTGPTLLVQQPGTYSLQLTTRCDSRTVARRVAYQSCLVLPNIITPNGDGRNDRLVVPGLTRGPWTLEVYNRWGRQVYRSSDYRHDWGADAAPGVYYYRLWHAQTKASYKGQVEVAR